MTYTIIWRLRATDTATQFLDDPNDLALLFAAVDLLAEDPRPTGSTEWGSGGLRRLHAGRWRVLYGIADDTQTVVILHVGQLR